MWRNIRQLILRRYNLIYLKINWKLRIQFLDKLMTIIFMLNLMTLKNILKMRIKN